MDNPHLDGQFVKLIDDEELAPRDRSIVFTRRLHSSVLLLSSFILIFFNNWLCGVTLVRCGSIGVGGWSWFVASLLFDDLDKFHLLVALPVDDEDFSLGALVDNSHQDGNGLTSCDDYQEEIEEIIS